MDIGLPLPWGIVPAERVFRPVTGADPAAGAEVSVSVPGGMLWIVQSVRVTFVAAAVAVSRRPALTYDDGSTEYARAPVGTDVTTGATAALSWFAEATLGGVLGANGAVEGPLPRIPLLPGHRIRTVTLNLDVLDNYGAPVLYVAEYSIRGLEGARDGYLRALVEAGVS